MQRFARYVWLVLASFPALLSAQGYGVYELSPCTFGRGGAAVASPCPDASAIFFNPAGLADLKGGHVSAGVTFIKVNGGFTDDAFGQNTSLDDPLIPVPEVYASYQPRPKLGLGLGFFAPYGLQTKWPTDFEGRFAGYNNIIHTYYVQPTAAYQVSKQLSLGVGLDIVHGSVELHQRIDLSTTPVPGFPPGTTFGAFGIPYQTDFADATLTASKTAFGGHFGAIFKVNDRISLGARYLMKVNLNYSGTASFTSVPTNLTIPATITIPGIGTIPAGTPLDGFLASLGLFTAPNGPLQPQTVTATLPNPDMFVAGIAVKPTANLMVLVDYQWTHWGSFQTLTLNFTPTTALNQVLYESYQNTSGIRFGADWTQSQHLNLRAGYLYHQGAAPDQTVTPLLPEGPRNEVSAGLSYKFSPAMSLDLAYQYIRQDDRRGRTIETPNVPPTTALNSGLYTFSASLFGVALAFAF
ncbi:MAG TPA: outer membrane protein transport protein [Gemmatimonadales bacterium]|nr:outer membrane protein transport protein [Gemmatimonadales bacterium]